MKVSLQPAFVLHQRPYRDSSMIIDLLTRDYGRVGLVAKGVKKSKSSLSSLLQPFRRLLVGWSGKGDLGTLVAAETAGSIDVLRGRIIMSGYYINELMIRLLHRHDPHPVIFSGYGDVLTALADISESHLPQQPNTVESMDDDIQSSLLNEERVLRIFEKDLLSELGYGLVLDHDVQSNEPVMPDSLYYYYINKGPVLAEGTGKAKVMPGEHEQLGTADLRTDSSRVSLTGKALLSFSANDLQEEQTLREIKGLMRIVVNECLGGKPLHTRQIYQALSQNKPTLYQEAVQ